MRQLLIIKVFRKDVFRLVAMACFILKGADADTAAAEALAAAHVITSEDEYIE